MKGVGALFVLVACTNAPPATIAPVGGHLVVPRLEHELSVSGPLYGADIPFRYATQTSDTLVITRCGAPRAPMLEWWDGTQWREAFHHIGLSCLGPPFVIPPGTVIHDTLRVRAFSDSIGPRGNKVIPYWLTSHDVGQYRLVWPLRAQAPPAERAAFRAGPLRPLSERVSNTFRLRLRRGPTPQN